MLHGVIMVLLHGVIMMMLHGVMMMLQCDNVKCCDNGDVIMMLLATWDIVEIANDRFFLGA